METQRGYRLSVFLATFVIFVAVTVFLSAYVPIQPVMTGDIDGDDVSVEGVLYDEAVADHYTQGYCQILPCNFPEGDENEPRDRREIAGFIFGTDYMTGADGGRAEELYYPHGQDHEGFEWENSGYQDRAAEVGMDNLLALNPVFYRGGIGPEDGYNIMMEGRSARIPRNSNECSDAQYSHGDDDPADYYGGSSVEEHFSHCDVYMLTSEVAFKSVVAGGVEFGGVGVPLEFEMEDYWVVTPEDDWCRTSLVQECLATAGDNDADAEMIRGFVRGYWFLLNDDATINDATFRIDEGRENFPLEWNCDDRASDHIHNRNDLPGCY